MPQDGAGYARLLLGPLGLDLGCASAPGNPGLSLAAAGMIAVEFSPLGDRGQARGCQRAAPTKI